MNTSELDYELPAGADRAAPGGAAGRVAAARLRARDRRGAAPRLPRPAGRAAAGHARRRQRHARRAGADPDRAARAARCCCSSGSGGDEWEGLARPTRRLRAGPALRPGRAARAPRRGPLAAAARRASRRARCRCRRTSTSRSPTRERYQTVYAREEGSAAAPTAGLHFTPELLARLDVERVTLHVGLDTFRPLAEETRRGARDPRRALRGARRRRGSGSRAAPRVLAVGTTTVRVLETLAARRRRSPGRTELFITPGLRVPPRRLPADELPPAALDAARARDGVRGRRGDAPPLPRSRSRSATASTRFGDAMLIL